MSSRVLRATLDAVLGPSGRVRAGSVSALLALALHLGLVVLTQLQAVLGLVGEHGAALLASAQLAGALVFYVLLRAGQGWRLDDDPALPLPQMAFGLVTTAGLQALGGPLAGVALALALLILAFALFLLPPPQTRALALFGFVAFVLAGLATAAASPGADWSATLVGIAFTGAVLLAGIAVLSLRADALRRRLRTQRSDLAELRTALEQAQERIHLLGSDDPLTGLANRRHMTVLLQAERARHLRSRQPLSLVLVDLDLFRRVNEAYGAAAGDTVLKRFAQAGRSTLRASDVMGRWGGEEFVLMLPETTPESAAACVERLRVALGRMRFDDIAPRLPITFSAGIAVCTGEATVEAAVDAADGALRRAKANGGDQTEIAPTLAAATA